MAEFSSLLLYSDSLVTGASEALYEALQTLALPMRPWSVDEPDSSDAALREACDRAERIALPLGEDEWILSADAETGTVSISGDLDTSSPMTLRAGVDRLVYLVDGLCQSLNPRFAFAGVDTSLPDGLTQAVLDVEIGAVFWLNFYGSDYLQRYGAEYFTAAPFVRVESVGAGLRGMSNETPLGASESHRRVLLQRYFAS